MEGSQKRGTSLLRAATDWTVRTGLPSSRPIPRKDKVRYSCELCGILVWGKPDLEIACLGCRERMV